MYTERRVVVDPLTIWRNRFSLQEFLAIRLKKIQVFCLATSSFYHFLKKQLALFFFDIFFVFSDFFNWNRVKLRYCDGGSFSGDSQNQVCIDIVCFKKRITLFFSFSYTCMYFLCVFRLQGFSLEERRYGEPQWTI